MLSPAQGCNIVGCCRYRSGQRWDWAIIKIAEVDCLVKWLALKKDDDKGGNTLRAVPHHRPKTDCIVGSTAYRIALQWTGGTHFFSDLFDSQQVSVGKCIQKSVSEKIGCRA
jgi:hypothetical protein